MTKVQFLFAWGMSSSLNKVNICVSLKFLSDSYNTLF